MRKKQLVNRIISTLAVAVLIISGLAYVSRLMERKSSRFRLLPFYEQKENFDVLFMGTSHVINAVLPMELWDQFGMVSYNLGGHGAELAISYWVLRSALEHCRPQVVVIDCKSLESEIKAAEIYSQTHLVMDGMPFGITKVAAAIDLLNDPARTDEEDEEKRTLSGLLWDFSVYHSRWEMLEEGDFNPTTNRQKGADVKAVIRAANGFERIADDKMLEGSTTGTEYLCRMIELCQNRGIDVLLTFLPFPATEEDQRSANRMEQIAKEYQVPCINFLKENVIQYATDMADAHSHVNFSGAQKITRYLGRYLAEQFGVPDQRDNPAYASWNDDYQRYLEDVVKMMEECETLQEYFLMLTDSHLDTIIELYDRGIYEDETYVHLLENLGVKPEELNERGDLIAVRKGEEATVCYAFKKEGGSADTVLGHLSYQIEDRGGSKSESSYVICVDGEERIVLPRTANAHTDIRFHVFDHETGKELMQTAVHLKFLKEFEEGYFEVLEMSHES